MKRIIKFFMVLLVSVPCARAQWDSVDIMGLGPEFRIYFDAMIANIQAMTDWYTLWDSAGNPVTIGGPLPVPVTLSGEGVNVQSAPGSSGLILNDEGGIDVNVLSGADNVGLTKEELEETLATDDNEDDSAFADMIADTADGIDDPDDPFLPDAGVRPNIKAAAERAIGMMTLAGIDGIDIPLEDVSELGTTNLGVSASLRSDFGDNPIATEKAQELITPMQALIDAYFPSVGSRQSFQWNMGKQMFDSLTGSGSQSITISWPDSFSWIRNIMLLYPIILVIDCFGACLMMIGGVGKPV